MINTKDSRRFVRRKTGALLFWTLIFLLFSVFFALPLLCLLHFYTHNLTTMGFKISLGACVEARVGPFLEKRGSQQRRYRSKLEGIVIKSLPNNCWRVKWTAIQKTCDLRVSDVKLYCKGPIVSNENLDTHFNTADHFESVTLLRNYTAAAANNPNRPAATSRPTPTPAVATPNPPAATSLIAAPVPAPAPATTMRSPSTLSLLRGSSLSSSPSTSTDNPGLSIQEDFNPLTHSQNAAAIIAMHSNNVTPPLHQPSLATTDDMSSTVSITATTTSNESSTVAISMTQTQDVSDAASTTTNASN